MVKGLPEFRQILFEMNKLMQSITNLYSKVRIFSCENGKSSTECKHDAVFSSRVFFSQNEPYQKLHSYFTHFAAYIISLSQIRQVFVLVQHEKEPFLLLRGQGSRYIMARKFVQLFILLFMPLLNEHNFVLTATRAIKAQIFFGMHHICIFGQSELLFLQNKLSLSTSALERPESSGHLLKRYLFQAKNLQG